METAVLVESEDRPKRQEPEPRPRLVVMVGLVERPPTALAETVEPAATAW